MFYQVWKYPKCFRNTIRILFSYFKHILIRVFCIIFQLNFRHVLHFDSTILNIHSQDTQPVNGAKIKLSTLLTTILTLLCLSPYLGAHINSRPSSEWDGPIYTARDAAWSNVWALSIAVHTSDSEFVLASMLRQRGPGQVRHIVACFWWDRSFCRRIARCCVECSFLPPCFVMSSWGSVYYSLCEFSYILVERCLF